MTKGLIHFELTKQDFRLKVRNWILNHSPQTRTTIIPRTCHAERRGASQR